MLPPPELFVPIQHRSKQFAVGLNDADVSDEVDPELLPVVKTVGVDTANDLSFFSVQKISDFAHELNASGVVYRSTPCSSHWQS